MTPDDPRHENDQDVSAGRRGDDVDELASALLDGELDAASATAARQRPDIVSRAAVLAAVRSSLRASSAAADAPPDPRARERAITAALAAYDDERRRARRSAVTQIDVRRAVRRDAMRRWLGAAAAVAVIGAGIAGLAVAGTGGDSGDEAAEESGGGAADTAGADEGQPESSEEQSEAGGGESATSDELAAVVDLGTFDSTAALVADVDARLATDAAGGDREGTAGSPSASSTPPGNAAADDGALAARCPGGVPSALAEADATVVLRGLATVNGTDVEVWVVDAVGGRRLVAVDTSCTLVVDRNLT